MIHQIKHLLKERKKIFNRVKNFCLIKEVVYVLVSSKYDLYINSEENNDKVSEEEALEFASNNNMLFAHISVAEKYENGINELIDKALKEYFKRKKFIK